MGKTSGAIARGLAASALLLTAAAAAQDGAALYTSRCANCHNNVKESKNLVYGAAGNASIIEAANAKGMGSQGTNAEFVSIAAYLDTVKPVINMARVLHDSPGTRINLNDIIVTAGGAGWQIITQIVTVTPPTKGTVTYKYANGFAVPSYVTYTPFPGQSGVDTWTYQGTGRLGNTTVRTASVNIDAGDGAPTTTVVEYYNAALDHYFITWVAAEQANLDAGKTPTKWTRTGHAFNASTVSRSGTSPVCRYYIPPGLGDSHFFGRGTAECDATGQKNPTFVLEDASFMHMFLPANGVCPPGTTNIYRVFSNRPDANHRYMTDKTVRDAMVAAGWIAEGDGPDLVVMCAP